jgi:tubulin polyglutamylase TTLL5
MISSSIRYLFLFLFFLYFLLYSFQNAKAWLIEVNSSPSMARENKLDADVKEQMIRDTIQLVDPLCYDRDALLKVLEERLEVLEREKNKPYVASFLGNKSSATDGMSYSMKDMNAWISKILHGKLPRMHGELPSKLGEYRRLCPGPLHDAAMKLKRTYLRRSQDK